jgi:hypothetical protein
LVFPLWPALSGSSSGRAQEVQDTRPNPTGPRPAGLPCAAIQVHEYTSCGRLGRVRPLKTSLTIGWKPVFSQVSEFGHFFRGFFPSVARSPGATGGGEGGGGGGSLLDLGLRGGNDGGGPAAASVSRGRSLHSGGCSAGIGVRHGHQLKGDVVRVEPHRPLAAL